MRQIYIIRANILRAAELRISIETIKAWEPFLRIDSLSCAIALFTIIATTLQFSSISRSCDDRHLVPLNLYNMILARSYITMILV